MNNQKKQININSTLNITKRRYRRKLLKLESDFEIYKTICGRSRNNNKKIFFMGIKYTNCKLLNLEMALSKISNDVKIIKKIIKKKDKESTRKVSAKMNISNNPKIIHDNLSNIKNNLFSNESHSPKANLKIKTNKNLKNNLKKVINSCVKQKNKHQKQQINNLSKNSKKMNKKQNLEDQLINNTNIYKKIFDDEELKRNEQYSTCKKKGKKESNFPNDIFDNESQENEDDYLDENNNIISDNVEDDDFSNHVNEEQEDPEDEINASQAEEEEEEEEEDEDVEELENYNI